jgi:adenylate kinase family enzyme
VKPPSELLDLISSAPARCGQIKVITIDGPAGAGKTTLARDISKYLADSFTVHMDDLYRGWDSTLNSNLTSELKRILLETESGELTFQKFNWNSKTLGEVEKYQSPKHLILEGVGSGQKSIKSWVAFSIWIEIPVEIGLARVIARDGDQVALPMAEFVKLQSQYFLADGTREGVDYRISGEFSN